MSLTPETKWMSSRGNAESFRMSCANDLHSNHLNANWSWCEIYPTCVRTEASVERELVTHSNCWLNSLTVPSIWLKNSNTNLTIERKKSSTLEKCWRECCLQWYRNAQTRSACRWSFSETCAGSLTERVIIAVLASEPFGCKPGDSRRIFCNSEGRFIDDFLELCKR